MALLLISNSHEDGKYVAKTCRVNLFQLYSKVIAFIKWLTAWRWCHQILNKRWLVTCMMCKIVRAFVWIVVCHCKQIKVYSLHTTSGVVHIHHACRCCTCMMYTVYTKSVYVELCLCEHCTEYTVHFNLL